MGEIIKNFLHICYQAIQLNNRPIPYLKAFIAGLAAALPVLVGLMLGNFHNGLIASLGGFAFLYVFRMPYLHRAKKIILVVIGLSICAFLGSLFAIYPIVVAILMALIAVLMVFTFGALNIVGPSAIFMILVLAMTSAMPETDISGALERSALIMAGGLLSLFFALMGWFVNPNKPERETLLELYLQLNQLLSLVGTHEFKQSHSMFIQYLNESNNVLQASYTKWSQTRQFKKMFYLNKRANRIWLILGEDFLDCTAPLPIEIIEAFDEVHKAIRCSCKVTLNIQAQGLLGQRLIEQLFRIESILNQDQLPDIKLMPLQVPVLKVLIQSFNHHSIAFIAASRFGLITLISALMAYSFEFPRSFWVPLSTVSVLSGVTVVATLHRSIQRAFGTVLGVLIATALLYFSPNEYLIILYIFFFCMMCEIFIVKNYCLTALFFTPSALIVAVASNGMMDSAIYFAEIRIIDVLIGTFIGLVGIFLINRDAASKRLEYSMAELLRSQSKLTYALFNSSNLSEKKLTKTYFHPMKIRWNNLTILHQTALGEIPKPNHVLQKNWELLYELKQLSYLLERVTFSRKKQILSDRELSDLLLIYEQLSNAIELNLSLKEIKSPHLSQFPLLEIQLNRVQQAYKQDTGYSN
ncbi:FUSC family protein [Acinetobacter sp. ANC 4173]|uniref:FUSC family protein n=1 Tax=Acinetobacter sp. ANC 4173 TaxID=2529837 RepID=UPI001040633B|nr:FUSC family protein [Acinetobacter sp. ANC 4173]TCB82367.1 FUSC family protein [Acinetobacter sp. ANC 4173]